MSDPRENLLKAIWDDANSMLSDAWIRSTISSSERRPDDPYADTGRILQRLLELGASPYDLALLCRNSSLGGAFTVLFEAQMQFSDCDELSGLHTELLNADPSGGQARPGTAPAMSTQTEGEQDGTSNGG